MPIIKSVKAPDDLLAQAKHVLGHSYSPYSHFPVAACLRGISGRLFAGCNIENASYGLTLCAEASALGVMISQGESKITEALILIPGENWCSPCGACRQRLHEFSDTTLVIHLCSLNGNHRSMTLQELLPCPFALKKSVCP